MLSKDIKKTMEAGFLPKDNTSLKANSENRVSILMGCLSMATSEDDSEGRFNILNELMTEPFEFKKNEVEGINKIINYIIKLRSKRIVSDSIFIGMDNEEKKEVLTQETMHFIVWKALNDAEVLFKKALRRLGKI